MSGCGFLQTLSESRTLRSVRATGELVELREKGVEVKEGSLEIVTVVGATVAVLYAALTTYDGFWSGVDRIRSQAKRVCGILARTSADQTESVGGSIPSTNISLGHLDKLHWVIELLRLVASIPRPLSRKLSRRDRDGNFANRCPAF